MAKYKIYKHTDEKCVPGRTPYSAIDVFGYDQAFDEEDKKDLWENHRILYLGGVLAVWVEEREKYSPLFHLMAEDDGHIFWHRDTDKHSDVHWLDNYIETLVELKKRLKVEE